MLPSPAGREASPGIDAPPYVRHRPERTLLYQLVEEHYPAFKAHPRKSGSEKRVGKSGSENIIPGGRMSVEYAPAARQRWRLAWWSANGEKRVRERVSGMSSRTKMPA